MPLTLDNDGLLIQPLSEIKTEYQQAVINKFGPGHLVNDKSIFGKLIGIFSERESLIQEAIEAVYQSQYISTAGGISLDRAFEITGVVRKNALPSTVNSMYATGTPSTAVTAEQLTISVQATGELFKNIAAFTLGSIGDETATSVVRVGTTVTVTISGGHSYPENSWVFIEGADQDEYNVLTQITNVSGTTFDYEISGTLPASPATGTIEVKEATNFTAQSVENGEIYALQGSLTVIETPVSGIDRVENANDAVVGNEVETDTEARGRYTDTIAQLGGGTVEAIIARLTNVTGVTSVALLQNQTDEEDANGLPPHSVEAFVVGGADADIYQAMLEAVSAGIKQYGNQSTTVTDSAGNLQPVAFSRLTIVPIYVDITVTTNDDPVQGTVFPVDGEAQIIDNLSSIAFAPSQDVWKTTIDKAILAVDGVVTVVTKFGTSPAPAGSSTVVITIGQQADIDSGDITGTIDGVPI